MTNLMKRNRWAALLLFALISSLNAQVQQVYVVDGGFADGRTSALYRIEPVTGAVLEAIGDVGANLRALAISRSDGMAYGVTTPNSPNPQSLVRIDLVTGNSDLIASLAPPGGADVVVQDMFYAGATFLSDNPVLIVLVETDFGEEIMSLDVTNGEMILLESNQPLIENDAALAATVSFPVAANAVTFGCDMAGNSILAPFLYTFGIPDPPPPTMDFSLPDDTCSIAGTRGSEGSYYAVSASPDGGVARSLIRIDVNDMTATPVDIGPLPDNTAGIAMGPLPAETVPVLGRTWLLWLSAGLLVVGIASLRRRTGYARGC